jgi:hypothetical protein
VINTVNGGSLNALVGYSFVALLSKEPLVDFVTTGASVSPPSQVATVLTGYGGASSIMPVFSQTKTVATESNGDLSVDCDLLPILEVTSQTGALKVALELTRVGEELPLLSKIVTYAVGDSIDVVSFKNAVKAGRWSVNDTFKLSVRVFKVLSSLQQSFYGPLSTAPNLVLRAADIQFSPQQNLNTPSIRGAFAATIDTCNGLLAAVTANWEQPILSPAQKIISYKLNVSTAETSRGSFPLLSDGAFDLIVTDSDNEGDVAESVLLRRYNNGEQVTLGAAGDVVYIRILATIRQNAEDRDTDFSDWFLYEIPSVDFPSVRDVSVIQSGMGRMQMGWTPVAAPSGYFTDSFLINNNDMFGKLIDTTNITYDSTKSSYMIERMFPTDKLDQYMTVSVVTIFKDAKGIITQGSTTSLGKVFMHKTLVIKSVNVIFNSDKSSFIVTADIDNGQKVGEAMTTALMPHLKNGVNDLCVYLAYDNATGLYKSNNLIPVDKIDYVKVVVPLFAANPVSSAVSIYPSGTQELNLLPR